MHFIARVNPLYLAAITCFAAVKDARYYLNGVNIKPHPEGGVLISATNGHCAGQIYDPHGFAEREITISSPAKAFLAALKANKDPLGLPVEACWIGERCAVVVGDKLNAPELFDDRALITTKIELMEPTASGYPRLERVAKKQPDSGHELKTPLMNPTLLKQFTDCVSILTRGNRYQAGLQFHFGGMRDSIVVRVSGWSGDDLRNNFVGLLMPMSNEGAEDLPRFPAYFEKMIATYESEKAK